MTSRHILSILTTLLLTLHAAAAAPSLTHVGDTIERIEAPFEMPQLQRPQFPRRTLSIIKTGAKERSLSTAAVQKAIDKLARQGGGTVIVPRGEWLTGRITLRSNINLHLEEGAELHFSGEISDYQPAVLTRNEGIDLHSLGAMIYARGEENIAITGSGRLIAPSTNCEIYGRGIGGVPAEIAAKPLSERIFNGDDAQKVFLPTFFGPVECTNVLVEGVTFEQSLFWNIAPVYCKNVIIRHCTVNAFGHGRTDGIDIDSSENVLIEHVTLDCGDDCIALKAGRGSDGMQRRRPTQNIVIRHCHILRGVGGIAIGSETAAMVRNVYATDVVMEQAKSPFFIKTRRPRGGGGENMWFENIHIMSSTTAAILFDMLGSATYVGAAAQRLPAPDVTELTPSFRNFTFKDVQIDSCPMLIKIKGLPESPVEGVTLDNISAPNAMMQLNDVGTITIK